MAALFSEIKGRAREYRGYEVISVFIGGGTPSVVDADRIVELLELLNRHYYMTADAEVTIEVNPGTVSADTLKAYYKAGINRLSIGLQSANDRELQTLGRIHTLEQFLECYEAARAAGFQNINVDIMSALPGQSLESYRNTLKRVLALVPLPEHISAYSLIVEEGTPFARWEEEGSLDVPDEDVERMMYEESKCILEEAGLHRYEISNYAREGYECRHNCGYWKRVNYVGFGIGAASMVDNVRFHNDSDLEKYLEQPTKCRSDIQILSVEEQMEEFMFLGLRMTAGVSEREFYRCFGYKLKEVYGQVIEQNIRDGLLCYISQIADDSEVSADSGQQDCRLALTQKGLDVSNYVFAQFLFDKD